MLELIIVPVTLLLGIALVYWGVNGMPGMREVAFASGNQKQQSNNPQRERRAFDGQRPARFETPPPAASVRQSDLLLTDLMSEMLDVRSQLSDLRGKVDTLSRAEAPSRDAAAASEEKPAARRRTATKNVA